MKTTTFMAVMAIVILFSCKKAQHITNEERKLNLTAPSGLQIAGNIADLKTQAASIVFDTHGQSDFELFQVKFMPVKQGYAAIIGYRLPDWTVGYYISLNKVRYEVTDFGIRVAAGPNALINAMMAPPTKYVCVKTDDCTSACAPEATVTVDDAAGTVDIDCGCNRKCTAKKVK